MRLLIIEDHDVFARATRKMFEREGFAVDVVGTCEDGSAALETVAYDAVVLDRGLPDGDGLDLLRAHRNRGMQTPVIVLTARSQIGDRVEGLDSGGDDYVAKPVAMEELVARVRAVLRRPGMTTDLVLRVGNVAFDTRTREVRVDDRSVNISRRETDVLEQLLRRRGRVVPKDILEEKIYGFDDEVASNSIEVHVSRLRKRLREAAATAEIRTKRGFGYVIDGKTDA